MCGSNLYENRVRGVFVVRRFGVVEWVVARELNGATRFSQVLTLKLSPWGLKLEFLLGLQLNLPPTALELQISPRK